MRLLLILLSLPLLLEACADAPRCDCEVPSFTIALPPSRAPWVRAVNLGADCSGASMVCHTRKDSGGCAFYVVSPRLTEATEYKCFVEVTFDGQSSFATTIRWHKVLRECCAELRFDQPPSIQVPPLLVDLGGAD